MREMKDSGLKWIGEVPKHWEVRKVKNYYHMQTGFTPDTKNESFYDDVGGYDWVNISDIQDGKVITSSKKKVSQSFVDAFRPAIIPEGSLMYSFKLSVGQTAFAGKPIYSNEAIASFLPDESVNLHYLRYSSMFIIENAQTNIYNAKILNQDLIQNAYVPFPPLAEQRMIAYYLDERCAEIDAVIERTKATIEEYKKLKQSIITEAVTKGIRGNRPMKDSGIEWIGEMPDEWNLIPFRHVLKERQEKNSPIKSTERLSLSIELGVTLYADKTTNLDRFKEDFEQYKLAHSGDLVMNSMNMIVGATGVSEYYGCVSPVYYTFYDELDDHATAKFCEYIFRSKTMLRFLFSLGKGIYAIVRGDDRVNTCRLKVSKEDLKSIVIPVPSVDEQREIIVYLQNKCAEIDSLIAKKTALLEEMETYKKSVIYEYVTGKKEVGAAEQAVTTIVYPYFPAVLSTKKARFAQAVLMSRVLDKCQKKMGRVKLEKMLYTIESSIGFDFDTEYVRQAAGPLDESIYECEVIISRRNKWYTMKSSKYGVSYTPAKDNDKYKAYYDKYFADYDSEIERIIGIFMDYNADQAEIVATLFAAWNDFVIDRKEFTDEELVDEVLNNWNDSKKRFSRDVWLRAIEQMRQNNIVPKGYGKRTVIKN